MTEIFDPYRKWLGIPPEELPPDYYRLLGIPQFEGDPDVIENAAHRQMAYVRTFQGGRHATESQRLLNELAVAKICLLNAAKKESYDEALRQTAGRLPGPNSAPKLSVHAVDQAIRVSQEPSPTALRSTKKSSRRHQVLVWAPLLSTLGGIALIVLLVLAYKSQLKQDRRNSDRTVPENKSAGRGSRERPVPAEDIPSKDRMRPATSDREQQLLQQLARAHEAFGRRDTSGGRTLLTAIGRPQRNSRLTEELDQTQVVAKYLDEFWTHAQRGLKQVQGALKLQSQPVAIKFFDRVIEVTKVNGDEISYRVKGQSKALQLRELPSLDAAALAFRALKTDDVFGRVYVATFLSLDQLGDRAENLRVAQRIFDELPTALGASYPYLQREIARASGKAPLVSPEPSARSKK